MLVPQAQTCRSIVVVVFFAWQLHPRSLVLGSEDDRRVQSQAVACLKIQQRFLQSDALRNGYPDVTISTDESRYFNSSAPFSQVMVREKLGFEHGGHVIEVLPQIGSASSVEQTVSVVNDSYAFMLKAATKAPERWLINRLQLDLEDPGDFDLAEIGYLGSFKQATPDIDSHEVVRTYYLKLKVNLRDIVDGDHLTKVRYKEDESSKQFDFQLPLKPFRRGGNQITVPEDVAAVLRLDRDTCLPTQLFVSFAHESGQYEAVTDIDYQIADKRIIGKNEIHMLTIQRPDSADKVYKMERRIRYDYDAIPRQEFTLSHYGLPEPGGRAWTANWLFWVSGVLAVACAAVLILKNYKNLP
ncbi:hypothetical protein [Allorhodopirellula solitaria]|uniref:Uncharacterized protein n=1 Tax=Allorhodopirellula solitaria TaxID=2527987 RepID=A0A5C5YKA0_9BACT|nr:hypothetical protein [Allorhodopirellula solitaria]TWT75282.1 hypothetical protein CA85_05720 [Allorhodopirellula solitaria]